MQWLDICGPALCGDAALLKRWRGTEASSVGETVSDYDRACRATEYLEAIAVCDDVALLLGDEPMPTAFLEIDASLAVVRWWSCDSKALAERLMESLPKLLPKLQSDTFIRFETSLISIVDSAEDGVRANSITANVEPGSYSVTTEIYEDPGNFRFLVHRLLRAS